MTIQAQFGEYYPNILLLRPAITILSAVLSFKSEDAWVTLVWDTLAQIESRTFVSYYWYSRGLGFLLERSNSD